MTHKETLWVSLFFGVLTFVGLLVGGILWGVLSDASFLVCFSIALPFSLSDYFLWKTSAQLLGQEKKQKVLGVLGIAGRFACNILSIVLGFVYLSTTRNNLAYAFVAPTMSLLASAVYLASVFKRGERDRKGV